MSARIYAFSGPSGAGKSTILEHVMQEVGGLGYSISHTSRKPRGQEMNGVEYHFVDRAVFEAMIKNRDFAEWAEVYGDYYGTSIDAITLQMEQGLDVLMDVDVQGAKNIKGSFQESRLIYILPPSLNELENRLRRRGTDEEDRIALRIEKAQKEIPNCVWYDYIIFNWDLKDSVKEAESIILADRCIVSRQLPKARDVFEIP
jgi:guanylate kinase